MRKSIREAYGEALVKYGQKDEKIVVLDADVSGSTMSAKFGRAVPERFFNVGIAEANMTSMAAGFAASGFIPFVNTFAVFLSSIGLAAARVFGSYSHLPLKLVGAYGGMSDAYDGPSHHALEDIATMRALPNFRVFVPCDIRQVDWLIKQEKDINEPAYIRLSRDVFPDIYDENTEFEYGKGNIVQDGSDITVIACGLMVGNALQAAKLLNEEDISVRVVDMYCIKPMDRDLIIKCAKETGAIVSAEEHNIMGGLGSAVAEVLCTSGAGVPMGMVGVEDCHAECGSYQELQKKYKIDAMAIAEKVKTVWKEKQ